MTRNQFLFVIIAIYFIHKSQQVYVPGIGNDNNKPSTNSPGIKTHRIQLHHNYSKVTGGSDTTSTVFNGHSYGVETHQPIYVLNGTRLGRHNNNPTREMFIYTKKRPPRKIAIMRQCPPDATGQFVYELACNQFLNCWKGRGYVQNCAPGTLFNPKTLECDFAQKVECVTGPRQNSIKPQRNAKYEQVNCPETFTGIIPNYTDCTKFINCDNGIAYSMECPQGTLFDIDKNHCDYADKANCFPQPQEKLAQPDRSGRIECPNGAAGIHPHPTDCSKFLNCANGQTFIQDCAPGTLFNPTISVCDFPHNVKCPPYNQAQTQHTWRPTTHLYTWTTAIPPHPSPKPTGWYRPEQNPTTANYHQIVNIATYRKPYEPFFGTTSKPNQKSADYEDTFGPSSHSGKYVVTTPRLLEKSWPPPFPSTDVNADYVFEYDDGEEVTVEAENSINKHTSLVGRRGQCEKGDFHCSAIKCIRKTLVCDGRKDCPDGSDEYNCDDYKRKYIIRENHKLAVLEKERWDNVSVAACAILCLESQKFQCKSFNYRKIDKTCFLTNTNEALTGALIAYYPCDYYELIASQIDCTSMYRCTNKKCIARSQLCDGHDDCGDRMDEKGCKKEDFGYNLKLIGSPNPHEGHIQVTAFGKTGYICDDQFGLRDANVVCKEVGYPLGAIEVKSNAYFMKTTPSTGDATFYMMDDVSCDGNETSLMDCDFSGWGVHNCLPQEVAGVVCKTPQEKCGKNYWPCDTGPECVPLTFVCDGLLDCTDESDEAVQHCDAPIQMRLVNGSGNHEGRIEIRYNSIWGTICDDDFNDDAAKVVCKQLGFKGSAIAKKDGHFGAGEGPIWLDQVYCYGNETSVEKCAHSGWADHNCEHSEDVGVICSNNVVGHIERHAALISSPSPTQKPPSHRRVIEVYPKKCGLRKDNIFSRNDEVHARVVRGSVAQRGDYPWQAALRVKGKAKSAAHWCGAVVISSRFVLTAAHCLIGYSKGAYVVVAGDYNVDEDEGTEQQAFIEDFYIHEDFRKGHKMNNDIALVKLKNAGFVLTEDVQPICLPDADTDYGTINNCTISGFGSIESGKSGFSHELRAGWIPMQTREVCTMPHVYAQTMTEGMICAGSLDEGIDSCDGDSGGPLACLHNGVFTLFGITSWGHHCGHANKPGVYVKVGHYKNWIDETLRKYASNN